MANGLFRLIQLTESKSRVDQPPDYYVFSTRISLTHALEQKHHHQLGIIKNHPTTIAGWLNRYFGYIQLSVLPYICDHFQKPLLPFFPPLADFIGVGNIEKSF